MNTRSQAETTRCYSGSTMVPYWSMFQLYPHENDHYRKVFFTLFKCFLMYLFVFLTSRWWKVTFFVSSMVLWSVQNVQNINHDRILKNWGHNVDLWLFHFEATNFLWHDRSVFFRLLSITFLFLTCFLPSFSFMCSFILLFAYSIVETVWLFSFFLCFFPSFFLSFFCFLKMNFKVTFCTVSPLWTLC